LNSWEALLRHGELPGRAFENSVTCSTGGEGFSCMQDHTLIGIFRRAIQAWLATDLPRTSNYAFLGRTIHPWTTLQRGMSRGPFSSYPQENYEKCHDNNGANSCIQCLHLHAMLTRSTNRIFHCYEFSALATSWMGDFRSQVGKRRSLQGLFAAAAESVPESSDRLHCAYT